MKIATVSDLRYDFSKLEAWLASGAETLISKHSKVVAKIFLAIEPPTTKLPPHANCEARRKHIWGDHVFTQAEVDEIRAFETGETWSPMRIQVSFVGILSVRAGFTCNLIQQKSRLLHSTKMVKF